MPGMLKRSGNDISTLMRRALLASMLLAASCDDGSTDGAGGTAGAVTAGGSGGDGSCDPTEPPVASTSFCDRFVAGEAGDGDVPIDWSRGHGWVRFFGPVPTYSSADLALAAALSGAEPFASPDVDEYVAALPPGVACGASASPATLGPASVSMLGDVAWVVAGTGAVSLPLEAKGVMVDVRTVPPGDAGRAAILAAIAPALATPVPGLKERVRVHTGLTDEVFAENNVYTNATATTELPAIEAQGATDLPLAVLTSDRLSPEASEIAATLRLAKRAWLVGEDLSVAVAESRWQGIGDRGVIVRVRDLFDESTRLADVVPADERSATPECFASRLLEIGAVPNAALGAASRPEIEEVSPFADVQEGGDPTADARAALLVAHCASRLFYPYFATVGDGIDARLLETLGALPAGATRADAKLALRRFGNALADGHQFVFDYAPPPGLGYLALLIEDLDGSPVIRRSAAPGIVPGDRITHIDGETTAAWYERELALSGGATPGYQFNLATRELLNVPAPVELELVDPDGATKTVTAVPGPAAALSDISVASSRPAGPLTDMGAPALFYVNLSNTALTNMQAFHQALNQAEGAAGLVVDMRGYPGININEVAQRLALEPFSSPIFQVPVIDGLDRSTIDELTYPLSPLTSPSFAGPIVLLVGHASVSAAENFSTMLVDAGRVTVMGRRSAGTNGNITGVQLPGGFAFTFTGMEVRHADAEHSQFHAIGIAPAVESVLTAQDFRDGIDRELEDAVSYLLTL